MVDKIKWNKLKQFEKSIAEKRKQNGLQSAVNYSEGILGLRRGEYIKNRPKIKRIIKKFF